jgi:hypothetical protein
MNGSIAYGSKNVGNVKGNDCWWWSFAIENVKNCIIIRCEACHNCP